MPHSCCFLTMSHPTSSIRKPTSILTRYHINSHEVEAESITPPTICALKTSSHHRTAPRALRMEGIRAHSHSHLCFRHRTSDTQVHTYVFHESCILPLYSPHRAPHTPSTLHAFLFRQSTTNVLVYKHHPSHLCTSTPRSNKE